MVQVFICSTGMLLVLGADPGPESSLAVTSVWDLVAKGGLRMIPIVICSLVAIAVGVERAVSLRRSKVVPAGFAEGMAALAAVGFAARCVEYCRSHASPIARVCEAGLRRWSESREQVEKQLLEAGQREAAVLRKNLRVLSVITSVAPLLGLLGTIIGMIKAFQTVAQSADALGRTEVLAGGIYEAMITTAAGLSVAIPSLLMYHWFSSMVDGLVGEMDRVCVGLLDRHGASVGGTDGVARPAPGAAALAPASTSNGVLEAATA